MTRFALTCCLLLTAAGCGSRSAAMHVWGTVRYQGRPVKEGQIVFVPIEETIGPSTGAAIQDGRYDVPSRVGPIAHGVYRVEISAMGAEKTYSPNVSGAGPRVTVREELLPPAYNQKSTLRVTVSDDPPRNQHDFDLN